MNNQQVSNPNQVKSSKRKKPKNNPRWIKNEVVAENPNQRLNDDLLFMEIEAIFQRYYGNLTPYTRTSAWMSIKNLVIKTFPRDDRLRYLGNMARTCYQGFENAPPPYGFDYNATAQTYIDGDYSGRSYNPPNYGNNSFGNNPVLGPSYYNEDNCYIGSTTESFPNEYYKREIPALIDSQMPYSPVNSTPKHIISAKNKNIAPSLIGSLKIKSVGKLNSEFASTTNSSISKKGHENEKNNSKVINNNINMKKNTSTENLSKNIQVKGKMNKNTPQAGTTVVNKSSNVHTATKSEVSTVTTQVPEVIEIFSSEDETDNIPEAKGKEYPNCLKQKLIETPGLKYYHCIPDRGAPQTQNNITKQQPKNNMETHKNNSIQPLKNYTKEQPKNNAKVQPKTNTKEQPKNNSKEQPKTNTKEQPKNNSKEQPKTNTNEQPKTNTKEQPKNNSKEQPKTNTKEQPKNNSKEQPKKNSKEQPKTNSKEQPKTNTKEQPKNNSKEQHKTNTKEQPKNNSKEQPKTNTNEQPKKNSKEQPKTNSKEQPKNNTKEQPKNNSKEQPKNITEEIGKNNAKGQPKNITQEQTKNSSFERTKNNTEEQHKNNTNDQAEKNTGKPKDNTRESPKINPKAQPENITEQQSNHNTKEQHKNNTENPPKKETFVQNVCSPQNTVANSGNKFILPTQDLNTNPKQRVSAEPLENIFIDAMNESVGQYTNEGNAPRKVQLNRPNVSANRGQIHVTIPPKRTRTDSSVSADCEKTFVDNPPKRFMLDMSKVSAETKQTKVTNPSDIIKLITPKTSINCDQITIANLPIVPLDMSKFVIDRDQATVADPSEIVGINTPKPIAENIVVDQPIVVQPADAPKLIFNCRQTTALADIVLVDMPKVTVNNAPAKVANRPQLMPPEQPELSIISEETEAEIAQVHTPTVTVNKGQINVTNLSEIVQLDTPKASPIIELNNVPNLSKNVIPDKPNISANRGQIHVANPPKTVSINARNEDLAQTNFTNPSKKVKLAPTTACLISAKTNLTSSTEPKNNQTIVANLPIKKEPNTPYISLNHITTNVPKPPKNNTLTPNQYSERINMPSTSSTHLDLREVICKKEFMEKKHAINSVVHKIKTENNIESKMEKKIKTSGIERNSVNLNSEERILVNIAVTRISSAPIYEKLSENEKFAFIDCVIRSMAQIVHKTRNSYNCNTGRVIKIEHDRNSLSRLYHSFNHKIRQKINITSCRMIEKLRKVGILNICSGLDIESHRVVPKIFEESNRELKRMTEIREWRAKDPRRKYKN